ncbi:glycosyltransferase family 8 protein [Halorhodospira sp. 9621]|uniref:glycosyltransferase family 8 protein n=1 Tax=Halorhodospira sp. 9621 TaxID=2899135 RepID=UPI003FCC6497
MNERISHPTDPLNILLCANNDFAQHAAVTLASLLLNNSDEAVYVTFVGDLSERSKDSLKKVANLSGSAYLSFLSLSELRATQDADLFPPNLPTQGDYCVKGAYSIDIYTRLLVSRIFDEHTYKVLYLDSDIVVHGSLRPLWETIIDPYPLAGVRVPYFDRTHLPNFSPGDPYINSGVLLYNLPRWRELECEQRCLQFLEDNSEIVRDPDQDALNGALKGELFFLQHKWNAIGPYSRAHATPGKNKKQPVVYHYNGPNKPWLYMSNHPHKHLYYRYLRNTPWNTYTPPDKSLINIFSKTTRAFLPFALRRFLKKIANPKTHP